MKPKSGRGLFVELHNIYKPITATPFRSCENYMEFEPCNALKPYIRCFWGTRRAVRQKKSDAAVKEIVTPDTCMDIIFTVDFTNNKIESRFCGIDDRTYSAHYADKADRTFFSFAIRFYAWGAAIFAEESMRDTKNAFFNAGYHFPKIKKEMEKRLFDAADICQFIPIVENILLNRLSNRHKNRMVFQAIHTIVANKGNLRIKDLKREVLIGERQLERLFREYVGASPKSLASMVRYQYLWRNLIYKNTFHIQDAVYEYGYADQAHLCHDFKKYHSMNMADAVKYAMRNVGNIQDADSRL